MSARAVLHYMHTWGGLTLGFLIVLLGLSGSALVFRADIEQWQMREWLRVRPTDNRLSLDRIIAIGAAQIPQKEVVRVVLAHSPADSVEVVLQKRRPRNLKDADLVSVFVDPYRGTVLGQRARASGWLWKLQDFHYALFAGDPGLKVNGIGAAILLLLAVSGPLLWWPGWRQRQYAFRIRAKPNNAMWRDLHALSGVVACMALALISSTALYYAYRTTATAAIALASGTSGVLPPSVRTNAGSPVIAGTDVLIAAARQAVPSALLDELRPSRGLHTAPAVVSFRMPGDAVIGRHRMFLDPASAAVMRIDRYETLPAGARLLANMAPWHYGSFGGRLTQWLWFVAGLLPAGLFASGLWLWLRRRRGKPVMATAST